MDEEKLRKERMETKIYEEYLKDFDEKVMLNNWFPLELRDRVFDVVFKTKEDSA